MEELGIILPDKVCLSLIASVCLDLWTVMVTFSI